MLAVIPIMIYSWRHFKAEEAALTDATATVAVATPTSMTRRKAATFDPNPAKAGWLTKLVLTVLCLLWIIPTFGTFVTSWRR